MASTLSPKLDFRTERKDLYSGSATFALVSVPRFTFLMVDGSGDPNSSPAYTAAVEALYTLSYTAKFASKRELGRDYVVAPLEGLWHGQGEFVTLAKDEWSWTMMIRQPDWLDAETWAAVREKASAKATISDVRRADYEEGLALQVLHVGPYDAEAPTIARMHEWIAAEGYVETLPHHEIYLSDPRRTPESKLRTILRQPVRKV